MKPSQMSHVIKNHRGSDQLDEMVEFLYIGMLVHGCKLLKPSRDGFYALESGMFSTYLQFMFDDGEIICSQGRLKRGCNWYYNHNKRSKK